MLDPGTVSALIDRLSEGVCVMTFEGKRLKDVAADLKKAFRDGARMEITASVAVMDLANRWDADGLREEAKGLAIGPWLTSNVHPTRRLPWYRDRAALAHNPVVHSSRLTERFETRALLWLVKAATGEGALKGAAKKAVDVYRKDNNSMPITLSQAQKMFAEFVTRGAVSECVAGLRAKIARLQEQIRGLGAEPVE